MKLWQALRRKQIAGLRFRRQFPLGPYFADFVCLKAKFIVELDGSQHFTDEQRAYDVRRTAWLEHEGFRVLRYDNGALSRSFDGVIRQIWDVATSRFEALSGNPPPIPGA
jgi:very-short-patch-repair endonuclease